MKHIKRLLACLLIAVMALAALAACATEEPMESAGEVSDFSSEKHFDINDILQNGDESEEGSASAGSSIGEESSVESSISTDESSTTVSQEQSGDEQPPVESSTNDLQVSQGEQSNPSTESTNAPSQGTTSQPSGGQTTGEFVVSEKKYTYKNENLMLLNVENNTDKHYDVTIKGKYIDKNGNVIKEESQTYIAFPSGWSNYFIFRPKGTFDGFDYSIQVKAYNSADKLHSYNGDPLSSYIGLTFEKNLGWERGVKGSRDLMLGVELLNRHPNVTVEVEWQTLVLDAQGEVYAMDYEYFDGWGTEVETFSGTWCEPIGGAKDGKSKVALRTQAAGEDETIPADIQGHFTVIFAIAEVNDRIERLNNR